uniref:Small ribosomal subunit protein uS9c n=1 Tax=Pedinomonas minor TaxID=3159 RepID=C7BEL7_PEDMN|nr:ribosomal protein S9 [Pedinomonas minor]ACQ90887.1 ribosomal protein S9 [Pedinomonas minor]
MKTTGRRKTAIAQAKVQPGSGNFIVNGKTVQEYLSGSPGLVLTAQAPLSVLEVKTNYDTFITVSGGGMSAQAEAIRLAIARALCLIDPSYRSLLKVEGFLTRDAREKERRKYGLKKARKAPQFSKR